MILPLYPAAAPRPLSGCYLELPLRQWQAKSGRVMLYANYISTLDGRIALRDASRAEDYVPDSIAHPRDWRLYQELAAQADVLITAGRFYRQWAAGRHQGEQPIGEEEAFSDIVRWRRRRGMPAQPDVLIVSRSLDLPLAALRHLQRQGRRVWVACGEHPDPTRARALEAAGVKVRVCGEDEVDGRRLRDWLEAEGYRLACMLAGPRVHAMLLRARVLDYLFLTLRHDIVGGAHFHTIVSGDARARFRLRQLLYDASAELSFACYRCLDTLSGATEEENTHARHAIGEEK